MDVRIRRHKSLFMGNMDREKFDYDRFENEALEDFFGFPIKVGDKLLKPTIVGSRSPGLCRCTVTEIKMGRIHLDNSKVPLIYPGRCVNVSYLGTMNG